MSVKPTADSTAYYQKAQSKAYESAARNMSSPKYSEQAFERARRAGEDIDRQSKKGKPGYDKNGFPIVSEKMKKGMNGMSVPRLQGSVVASTPMAKSGQSFAAKNAAKGSNLKAKAKSKLKKK
jgi:hypothetical protein